MARIKRSRDGNIRYLMVCLASWIWPGVVNKTREDARLLLLALKSVF